MKGKTGLWLALSIVAALFVTGLVIMEDVFSSVQEPTATEVALDSCDEMLDALRVGPPIADQTRCRTAEGGETLLTVALEDSPEWEFVGPGEPMKRKR